MDFFEAIEQRHSVRSYIDKPITSEIIRELEKEIARCNKMGGLNIQLVTDEAEAFSGLLARCGKFRGVKNYLALVGPKERDLEERIGYYGEHLALIAQQLGLNTCWSALSCRKSKCRCEIGRGEKLVCVLALGYGDNQGVLHRSKPVAELCRTTEPVPEWFARGMAAAAMAPTAMNQQQFMIILEDGRAEAVATGGFYSKLDLGIVKYHFGIGAERDI